MERGRELGLILKLPSWFAARHGRQGSLRFKVLNVFDESFWQGAKQEKKRKMELGASRGRESEREIRER